MQDLGPYPYQLILGTNIGSWCLKHSAVLHSAQWSPSPPPLACGKIWTLEAICSLKKDLQSPSSVPPKISKNVWHQHLYTKIVLSDERVLLAHLNHSEVAPETDHWNTQKPKQEGGQRHQPHNRYPEVKTWFWFKEAQTLFIWKEDQDRLGWFAWWRQYCQAVPPIPQVRDPIVDPRVIGKYCGNVR